MTDAFFCDYSQKAVECLTGRSVNNCMQPSIDDWAHRSASAENKDDTHRNNSETLLSFMTSEIVHAPDVYNNKTHLSLASGVILKMKVSLASEGAGAFSRPVW